MSLLLFALLVGVFVAWLTNGDLRKLEKAPLRHAWLFAVAFVVQFAIFWPSQETALRYGRLVPALYIASFVLVLGALAVNLRTAGIPLAALGVTSNLVAIAVNGGYMPTTRAMAERCEALGSYLPLADASTVLVHQNSVISPEPRLLFLGDVLSLPGCFAGTAFSLGDVLLSVGIVWLLLHYSRRPKGRHRAGRPAREGSKG